MLDIDHLMRPDVPIETLDLTFLNTLDITTFEADTYCDALHRNYISDTMFSKVLRFIYAQNIQNNTLVDAIFSQANLSKQSPIEAVFKDIYMFYAHPDYGINISDFADNMGKLDPSNNITQYLLKIIWSDFDLSMKLTDSLNIDKYNAPQVVLLSISTWWPELITHMASLSSIYEDSQLPDIFFQYLKEKTLNMSEPVYNIEDLFI